MFSPATEHARATFPGLYVGQVEEVEKVEEQSEDKKFTHGRIKVSIPSVFDQEKPEDFVWARPCFPYGHFYVPEKKDKVWIAFENGDPKAPVWLGVWYPDGKAPPEAKASPPVKRVIHSSKNHMVILDDTNGSEALVLKDKANNSVELQSKKGKEALILADKSGNRIELRSDGVLIKCTQNLMIDASGKKITIKASSVDVQQE